MKRIILILCLTLQGCAAYHSSWRLPFHATSDQLQAFACERYRMCSGYAGLLQLGDEPLTISDDVRRGSRARWCRFDEGEFKRFLRK